MLNKYMYYVNIVGDVDLNMPDLPQGGNPPVKVEAYAVHRLLCDTNTRKATHASDYPSWVSKNNAVVLAEPMADIVYSILSSGIYPKIWKSAEVTPLPNTANPKSCEDYRPISLLFHLSKVTEKIINRELAKYIEPDINQYAYTKNIGTGDAIVKMVTDIAIELDNSSTCAVQALYLDFSKAFDLMRPDMLAKKLISKDVDPYIIHLVLAFLHNGSQCVKVNEKKSPILQTKLGVPQGTISGPTLWNVYVDDLRPINNTIKYADDTTLYR